jgi:hypothetical protein
MAVGVTQSYHRSAAILDEEAIPDEERAAETAPQRRRV